MLLFLLGLALCLTLGGLCLARRHRCQATAPAFRPKRPATPARARRKPAWVVPALIRLQALMPRAGCRQLADTFNRLHADRQISVGKTYVSTVVRQHRYAIAQTRRHLKHRIPQALPRNRTWVLDLTGKADATGRQHAILGLIDHGSRRTLCLRTVLRKNSLTLLGHLLIAIGRHGRPACLRTDNERVFTSRRFRLALAWRGIRHQTIDPGCPWQNGRIERLFGTLKGVLDPITVASREELQKTLTLFAFWYNRVRPHRHLHGRTPQEAWDGIDPWTMPVKSAFWFDAGDGAMTGYYLRR